MLYISAKSVGMLSERGEFEIILDFFFLCTLFNTASQDSTVSEDAGIEPRTVVTLALTAIYALTTWLDLIHTRARSHPHSARSHPSQLDLIYLILISLRFVKKVQ
jgi:hypothetical protein